MAKKSEDSVYDDDDIVSEVAEYSPKSEFSKPKLAYEASSKCIESRGKEMISGFWNMKSSKDGTPYKTWIEDSRKVYIGCVEALNNIMFPERQRNSLMKEFEEYFVEEKKKLFKKYCYTEKKRQIENGRIIWKETGKKMLPPIGAVVVMRNMDNEYLKKNVAEEVKGGWDNYINAYHDELLLLYDEMFAHLNNLIDSLNYFKQEISF